MTRSAAATGRDARAAAERRSWPDLLHRAGSLIDRHLGVLFLLPGVGIILLILSYPIVFNLYLSFTNKHLYYPGTRLVGFENFARTLADPLFYGAFLNTVVFTAASIVLQLLLGLGAALLLNQRIFGRTFFRLALIVPYAFPPVTVSLIWKWLLHSLFGGINFLLIGLGLIERPVAWLSQPDTAMAMAILVNVWFGFPLFALAILAGLQSIPAEYYEAARIDGANAVQMFRHITIPLILKIVGIIVVLRTIWIFNTFDLIFVLTGGGPINATETLPLYAYRLGWGLGYMGQTAATAVILFLFLALFIWLYFRLFRIEEATP